MTKRVPENLTVIGVVLFAVTTLLMHLLQPVQPALSVRDDAVNYYMNGPFGWVMGGGLVALGLGSLAGLPCFKGGSPSRSGRVA